MNTKIIATGTGTIRAVGNGTYNSSKLLTLSSAPASAVQGTDTVTIYPIAASVSDGSITASSFADGAITAAKIADGALTAAKFASNAITAAKIASDAITAIQSGLATASGLSTAQTALDGIIKSGEEFTASGSNDTDKIVTFTRN